MSITIVAQPPKLILSKAPVSFTADSTNAGTPLRIKANISGETDSDSCAVDGNGQASFELSDYLQGLITMRHKTDATPVVYTNNPAVVQIEFHELVGSPAVAGDQVVSDPFYVIDGFVPKSRRKALYATYSSLLAYLAASKSCLTWWPEGEYKLVQPLQKEFINYLQVKSITPIDISLFVGLRFTDSPDEEMGQVFNTLADVDYLNAVYFPAGYTELSIAAFVAAYFPTRTLVSYSVALFSGEERISKIHFYTLDGVYRENERLLYIRNSFGMLEVVPCTGLGEQTNEFKIEVARTDGHILPDKISWKFDKSDVIKANTGFLTKAQMQWLSDMDFTEAYELIGTVLHPIVFNDLKLPVIHDGEYQYFAELEYEYAYNETTEAG